MDTNVKTEIAVAETASTKAPIQFGSHGVQLLNACRTLWHQRKSGAPIVPATQPADDGENVPF